MKDELTKEQWHDVRSGIRIFLRNKKDVLKNKNVIDGLENIEDEVNKDIFKHYYLDGWGLVKISMTMYYDERTIRRRIDKATKQFAEAYANGLLIELAKD